MPNWCDNELIISGPRTELLKFIEENTEETDDKYAKRYLYFEKMIPIPPDEDDTIDWAVANWGTKWDAQTKIYADNETELKFDIETAWSPPMEWVKKVSRFYPKLHFQLKYGEPGMDFSGVYCIENNEILEDYGGEYGDYYGSRYNDSDIEIE